MRTNGATPGVPRVVIIGAGVIGVATAYELARRGVGATVLERDVVAAGQSGRNWGFVRQQGRSPQELPLMRSANQRWQDLEAEIGESFDWVQGGNLALAEDERAARRYRSWIEVGTRHGVDSRLVDRDEVRELVPGLRLPHAAAIYTASDGHVDPTTATAALARAAERHGATVLDGHTVHRIAFMNGRVTGVDTNHGVVPADIVVCAAGATSRWLLGRAGLRLPQNVIRGTVAMTEPVDPFLSTTVWASGLAFRQRPDGRLVISTGGGGEIDLTLDTVLQAPLFLPGFLHNHRRLRMRLNRAMLHNITRRLTGVDRPIEPSPNRTRAHASLRRLRSALPQLARTRLEQAWAGIIDATPDGLPVVDRPDVPAGLVVATGFSGHGFGLAPAIGQVVADLVLDQPPRFDLRPFRLSRFAERDFHAPDAIL
ncbi:FAD-binding oxidoreductase [Pseudonocardia sp. MH-G8]|uniref:NAD(P)/FAD-dependent oxidoreductase n=1 Tax=Pseudonocardia sp. MH-G8 TaxID=1854588 RepID=UPI000BA06838|nr:FAD-binding oxidoreductase [Pseudonocardia sp. MH-G8]OZM80879.1 FAD-dependent oxidoreductase [Pseudonocardia sp. MH-G8]